MKMKATLFSLCLAIGALAITACSKEDNNDREEETTFQAVQFRMVEEGFGTETELTRVSSIPSAPALSEVGDCETETTVESEPAEKPTAATRGVTTPTHYTIRIYEGSTLKGEMKGTFTATGFMPDAGSPTQVMLARNHTYTFLCFNDQVTPVGDKLEIALANAATARIGRQQITLGNTDQTVNLSSMHVGVRVHTQLVAKKDIPTAVTATLQSTGNNIPQRVSYDPSTGSYTSMNTGTMPAATNNSPASAEAKYTASNYGQIYAYTSTCPDYHYFLPTTDVMSLKLNITAGQIFWKQLSGSINKLANNSHPFAANGTYRIKVKMKPSFTYLMSDGTTGFYKETTNGGGDKTPIAVVVNPDTRMAVALKAAIYDYSGGNITYTFYWCPTSYENTKCNTNSYSFGNFFNAFLFDSPTHGFDETWKAGYSKVGIKAATFSAPINAFERAATYNPGVTITGGNVSKWYLPSSSDWVNLFTLGFGDKSNMQKFVDNSWYGDLVRSAFTQVGGTFLLDDYWTSSEVDSWCAGTVRVRNWGVNWFYDAKRTTPYYTLAFVDY